MASSATATDPQVPGMMPDDAALQHSPWRRLNPLSRGLLEIERFLGAAGFDRAPWLAVAFAGGISAWFVLSNHWQWLALLMACGAAALAAFALMRGDGQFPWLRVAMVWVPIAMAAGMTVVWTKSALVGAEPLEKPMVETVTARVLSREQRPAEHRVRLVLAAREPASGRPIRVRVNLADTQDSAAFAAGAVLRLRVRLMPPAPPMLPGGYDFARAAWFGGLAATGSVLGKPEIVRPAGGGALLAGLKASLTAHVSENLPPSSRGIAAALASGDRGSISEPDAQAMRDSGLAHLLSISGLHVSAVIAAVYFLAMRLLALWPWLALRVRLPLCAAGAGAVAGIGYTLLTGAEVPTVRSCIGAVLVLIALALGREALSFRMLAVAALFVMLLWPEAVIGPSFQMSFAAVIAIVALSTAAPVRRLLAPREEGMTMRAGRHLAMLLLTGVVIEIALMPIGLFHFHRAGLYGASANVVAIPLTTVVTMPLIALALLLDIAGLGAPAWWLAGKSIELLLGLAHWIAAQPGAVTNLPAMSNGTVALFAIGGLWLALWHGRVRYAGLLPIAAGVVMLAGLRAPDVLISGDGRHVGITTVRAGGLLVLRDSRSDFARDNLVELAGMSGEPQLLADWPGARCSADFCILELDRGGRKWQLLMARSRNPVPERELAAICDRVDIAIADRWLPRSCQPRLLKADRNLLTRTGGLALDLERRKVRSVAAAQGEHGWWKPPLPAPPRRPDANAHLHAGVLESADPAQPAGQIVPLSANQ